MGSLVAELAEKLSSATNNFDIDEGTMYVNTSADTVGIGTTNPASKLDVQGTMQVGVNDTGHDVKFFGATAGAYLEWDESADELEIRGGVATPGKLLLSTAETTVVDGNKLGQIDFQAPVDSAGTDAILVGASIYAEADATFSASVNATELVFATGASEAAAEKMRITSDGKVGIGTTAPVTTWAAGVSALALKGASGDNYSVLELYNHGTDANNDYLGIIDFGEGSNQNASIRAQRESATNDAFLTLWTNNQGSITEKMRISASGLVGIGTTAPSSALHISGGDVAGSGTSNAQLHIRDTAAFSAAQNAGIAFEAEWQNGSFTQIAAINASRDSTSTGQYGGHLKFNIRTHGANVSEAMRILSDGKVGIGTTAPGALLHVIGNNDSTSDATAGRVIVIGNSDTTNDNYSSLLFRDGGGQDVALVGAKNTNQSTNQGDLVFWTRVGSGSITQKMVIKSDGKVGIGTTAPAQHLALHFTSQTTFEMRSYSTTAGEGAHILLERSNSGTHGTNTAVDDDDILGAILFRGASGTGYNTGAEIRGIATDTFSGTAAGTALEFYTVDNDTTTKDLRMMIDENGEVGIGTTSPTGKLHVHGDQNYLLYVKQSDTNIHVAAFRGPSSSGLDFHLDGGNSVVRLNSTGSGHAMRFDTEDGNERMRIQSGGNVGIASTAPNTKLDIGGECLGANGFYPGTYDDRYRINSSSSGNGSNTVYIGNQTITTSSDKRLKKNISDSELDALTVLDKIKFYDFNWNDPAETGLNNKNSRGRWTGFLAQEAVEHFPTMINAPRKYQTSEVRNGKVHEVNLSEDDPEYGQLDFEDDSTWLVDQTATTPLMMKAIQELSEKVKELENKSK